MRGLTLTQPWATLVAIDQKQYETRGWSTKYQGDIAIQAAKGFPTWAKAICNDPPFRGVLRSYLQELHPEENLMYCDHLWKFLPVGKVLCVVNRGPIFKTEHARRHEDMTRPYELNFGDYSDGRYAWRLDMLRVLKDPVEAKGALCLWTPDSELIAKIVAQLPGSETGEAKDSHVTPAD